MTEARTYDLEPAAAAIAAYFSQGPPLYEQPLSETRKAIDASQSDVPKPDVEETWVTVPAGVGDVRVLIIKPRGAETQLPVVLYMHGGGWVFGSAGSHGRLAAELGVASDAAVLFVEYALAPEAKYPVQIEQCYAVARWVSEQGESHALDASRIAVAGDSAGGNMATVLCLLAKKRGDVSFVQQSMYYPMTDALTEDTESYRLFKDGPYGDAATMDWFWSSYLPEQDVRLESTVSPLRATPEELAELPPALVIVDENDVLRDQGEAYAGRLRDVGVPTACVRFDGTMHDFMMLAALRDTETTRAAIDLAASTFRRAFGTTELQTRAEENNEHN
ncbi:MAG TPA: alpha/beta hydrolase [Gaiellaceae bacterium]|nr:alpha/beta hydrolase [Gaiellaceae bacterium]